MAALPKDYEIVVHSSSEGSIVEPIVTRDADLARDLQDTVGHHMDRTKTPGTVYLNGRGEKGSEILRKRPSSAPQET